MAETPLAKKLGIKPGNRLLILNAPDGYPERLEPLPDAVEIQSTSNGSFDVIQVFVRSKADVDTYAPVALDALQSDGILWFIHPKKSSKLKTDVSRDTGWDAVKNAGWEPVASISIDETWSGLRFRPSEAIKRRPR